MILAANYLLASLYMQDYFPGEDFTDVDSSLDEDSYGEDVSRENEDGATSSEDEKVRCCSAVRQNLMGSPDEKECDNERSYW